MTKITRAVVRETNARYRGDALVVELLGTTLAIWRKGKRGAVHVSYEPAYSSRMGRLGCAGVGQRSASSIVLPGFTNTPSNPNPFTAFGSTRESNFAKANRTRSVV